MARLLRFVAVVALVGGATASVTACSSDPGPIVTETPSPTRTVEATPSPSPTPTVTPEDELLAQIPEDARGEDFYSASQFAKFYLELYPQMMNTLDGELFEMVSSPECEFCASALDTRQHLEDSSESRSGGEPSFLNELASGGQESDGTYTIVLEVEIAPSTTIDSTGAVVGAGDGGPGSVGVSLTFAEGHWLILGVNHARAS